MKSEKNSKKRISKIVSVLIAVLIWIFVIYTENPSLDISINAIDVQFLNEGTLIDKNLMVVNKSSIPDASLIIRGKRQDLISVMGSISSTVDLSQISEAGVYKLQPVFDIPSNAVYISKRNTRHLEISIEDIIEKEIDVVVNQKNADKNKTYIIESIPENPTITVKGSYKDISKIDHAAISVDVSSVTSDISETYDLILEDSNNAEISPENSLFYNNRIEVNHNIYEKVTLKVNAAIPSNINKKYTVELLSQDFKEVSAGIISPEGRTVTTLTTLNILSDLEPGTKKYTLKIIQPEGIYLPPESKYITVELEVFERVEKTVEIPINVKNSKNKNYTLSEDTVKVSISGPKEKLKADNVKAELNLDNISAVGEQTLKVKTYANEKDITIENKEVFANIIIEE